MAEKIFFTSDTHFGHHNVLNFCKETRPCSSVEEMDTELIYRWNHVVGDTGTIYHLGDVSFSGDEEYNKWVLGSLKGRKHLIYGNHDKVIRFSPSLQQYFSTVQDYKRIQHKKLTFILSHFPMRMWDKAHNGAYHLYGHCHGVLEDRPHGRSMDVGVDTRPTGDMTPWHIDEITTLLNTRPILDFTGREKTQ